MSIFSSLLILDCHHFCLMFLLFLLIFAKLSHRCNSVKISCPIRFQHQFINSTLSNCFYFLENHQLKIHLTSFIFIFIVSSILQQFMWVLIYLISLILQLIIYVDHFPSFIYVEDRLYKYYGSQISQLFFYIVFLYLSRCYLKPRMLFA